MNCDDYQLALSRFIDGEPSSHLSGEVYLHLSECEECREFYHTIIRMQSAFSQAAASESVSPANAVPTLHLLLNEPKRRWIDRKIEMRWTLAAALTVIISGLVFAAVRLFQPPAIETVYVTKLPAVIVTSEKQTTYDIN